MPGPKRSNMPHLYEEHLILGASFDSNMCVDRYGSEGPDLLMPSDTEAYLCDVSHISIWTMYGEVAQSYAEAAFAGKKLKVGECSFEAALTGDGSVASIPLLSRTGNAEYVAFDPSPRGQILDAWLQFLKGVSHGGYAPYSSLGMQEATGTHVAFAIWGPKAQAVLGDYTSERELPKPGRIVSCNFDKIPCIVAHPHDRSYECYLVLVPPATSVALWRSLLSFGEVAPVGTRAFEHMMLNTLPWYRSLSCADSLRMGATDLAGYGLIRRQPDFVGARGLEYDGGGVGRP